MTHNYTLVEDEDDRELLLNGEFIKQCLLISIYS